MHTTLTRVLSAVSLFLSQYYVRCNVTFNAVDIIMQLI